MTPSRIPPSQAKARHRSESGAPTPTVGREAHPLRVAIIGAGPAGFCVADHLLSQESVTVAVDLFDRLPNPFGLVRAGVVPDHQHIKDLTRIFDRVAAHQNFCFYGNVAFGEHLSLDDLRQHYHQVVFATGAQTDRGPGMPGEDLAGSYSAAEFVAWYNGHPAYRHLTFNLSQERVAIIGMDTGALDVARILCLTPEELERPDIAPYVLEALRHSRVREVYVLGCQGPDQAAFTQLEAREGGEPGEADVVVLPEEAELDPSSQALPEQDAKRDLAGTSEIVQAFARHVPADTLKTLVLRFLVSPVAIRGDARGQVVGVRLVRNELYQAEDGELRLRATDTYEDLPAGLVFRSAGYRGVLLPGVPFDEQQGTIPNEAGRVLDPATGHPAPGLYVSGGIKRGTRGTISTNGPDAAETARSMLDDLRQGRHLWPLHPEAAAAERLIRGSQPHALSYTDWQRLDELEGALGAMLGRPRLKLAHVSDILAALGRQNDCYVCGQFVEDKSQAFIVCRISRQADDPTVLTVKKCCLDRLDQSSGKVSMHLSPIPAARKS